AHHENLFVSWDEITIPFKIKKHAGHPLSNLKQRKGTRQTLTPFLFKEILQKRRERLAVSGESQKSANALL
ncbi:MAG: hypothetical protein SOZ39_04460, partial [Desulfovibrio piger]|uniref:hypothetical protein n=1 Tax=Desulfovibrio piger TaxID=901 RepID=UPI002A80905C